MNFNQISFKIFKANLRRYLLFFFCSSFAIMIFFTYSTILTNKDFMNPNKVNSSISSMLIAPSLGIVLFSVLFIIYAHSSFVKFRKTEFGLFMVLGMTNWDIGRIMLFENS
ncbi:MAG TPA: FtsX-like permease family protein, partial [Clostridia bacterium]|nr:FtsX-like permease family protein [Clostridia bacterium]